MRGCGLLVCAILLCVLAVGCGGDRSEGPGLTGTSPPEFANTLGMKMILILRLIRGICQISLILSRIIHKCLLRLVIARMFRYRYMILQDEEYGPLIEANYLLEYMQLLGTGQMIKDSVFHQGFITIPFLRKMELQLGR